MVRHSPRGSKHMQQLLPFLPEAGMGPMTPLVFLKELGDRGLDASRVNLHGGAVAVGHPLGATGGILLANALEILRRRGGGYGLLVIPAALGVAMAVVIEAIA